MSMANAPAEAVGSASKSKFTPRAAILAVMLIAIMLYMVVPLRQYLDQRSQLAQMERQTELLQRKNTQLQRQVRELHDPAFLERMARECLGMVRPGQIGFVVVPKGQQPPPPAC
jgi:cell division protein FtsL